MSQSEHEAPRRFLGVGLLPGVTYTNMTAFYIACLAGITLSTFLPQMLPFLLTEFLQIPENQQGVVSGNIAFYGEIAIIIAVGIWGTASDKMGRRPVMAIAFAIMALAVLLFPRAGSVNELLIYRVIFGIGVAAFSCMTITIMADYARDESRGKATGFLGMANAIGAMITVFFLLRLPAIFQSGGMSARDAGILTYQIVAGFGVLIAIWMWFGLQKRGASQRPETSEGFWEVTRNGLKAARDPGIALAYGSAFVSRGNLAIVGTFFTLWLANYGTSVAGLSRADALAKAGLFVGIAQGVTLIGAPLFGVLSDRLHRVDALIASLAVSAIGYGGTFFVDDPFSGTMVFCAIFIGLGEVGVIITSGVLIAQQTPVKIRGSVIGFYNLSGALGILVAAKLGGWLFDNWREPGPFVLFGVLAALVIVWSLIVRNRVVPPADAAL